MTRLALAVLLIAGVACRDRGQEEAEQAVRTYLSRVVQAYRAGDEEIVDPLVGDEQGRRLVGLIGVKREAGVVLDAKLLSLEFTRTAREGEGWVVETRERWYYADRRIETGQQVGADSTDSYAMRYRFERVNGKLVLEQLEFAQPPVVGRTVEPQRLEPRALHTFETKESSAPPSRPPTQAPAKAAEAEKRDR